LAAFAGLAATFVAAEGTSAATALVDLEDLGLEAFSVDSEAVEDAVLADRGIRGRSYRDPNACSTVELQVAVQKRFMHRLEFPESDRSASCPQLGQR
jgi:hypothetical protein